MSTYPFCNLRMDTRENKVAWWISGVLLILLVIVGYLWLTSKQDLATVLANGHASIDAERVQIQQDCVDQTSLACKQDLSDLQSILQNFSNNLQNATITPATTTSAY